MTKPGNRGQGNIYRGNGDSGLLGAGTKIGSQEEKWPRKSNLDSSSPGPRGLMRGEQRPAPLVIIYIMKKKKNKVT